MKALTPPRLLAASAAACFLLPSCQRNSEAKNDPQWWRLEADRVEVASQVELYELKLSKLKTGDQGAAALEAGIKRDAARRAGLTAERDALKQEIELAKQEVEAAKIEGMREARTAAMGREFATFTGSRGRTYENAVVTNVSDVGVEFRHSTGTARLAAKDLTPSQHEMFGLDAERADEAIREEQETALAYHSKVDAAVAARAAAEEKKEDKRVALASVATSKPVSSDESLIASASVEPRTRLGEAPRSVSSRRSSNTTVWYHHNYYSYSPYYYRYYYGGVGRYRPSASVMYDPYTGGSPRRTNSPSPKTHYRTYSGGSGSSSRSSGYSGGSSSGMRSPAGY